MSDQTEQHIAEINGKLDRILRLLALTSVSPGAPIKERAITLSRAGFTSAEIAELVGTTTHSISQTLLEARKTKKTRRKKNAGKKKRNKRL